MKEFKVLPRAIVHKGKLTINTPGQPTSARGARRVHKAPTGFSYAPMPKPLSGEINRVLQGGYPPVPYRTRNDWSGAGRYAGEPFACPQIRGEVLSSRKDA